MHIAAEAVQLGHCNSASLAPSIAESSGKLWTAVEGVSTLARLDLYEDADKLKPSEAAKRARASRCASMPKPRDRFSIAILADMFDDE